MAEKPVGKQDLVDAILELRNEAERRLMRNKYYLAMRKLDELLEVIRPLETETLDESPPAPLPRSPLPGEAPPRRQIPDREPEPMEQLADNQLWQPADPMRGYNPFATEADLQDRERPLERVGDRFGDANLGEDEELLQRRSADFGA